MRGDLVRNKLGKYPLTAQPGGQLNSLTILIEKEPKCPSKARSTFERPTG
jgi:hypothetical protein